MNTKANKLIMKIESKLSKPLQDEVEDKGWALIIMEGVALSVLCVGCYVVLAVMCEYIKL